MKIGFITTVIALFLVSLQLSAQGKTKSGLVVNGGIGSLTTVPASTYQGKVSTDYKLNLSVGYRFRLHPVTLNPFFLDLDVNLGMKSWNFSYGMSSIEPPKYEASSQYYSISTSGTLNYPIYKGLSIGAGFEPTYYFLQEGETSNNKFDIPVVGKIAYDFKILELGISYKYGLMNTAKTDYLKSGKFQDWQLSVWIPF